MLRKLSSKYLIKCHVVLAYMPYKRDEYRLAYSDASLPKGIETVNQVLHHQLPEQMMIEQSDFVVTYVVHDLGSGAAKFKKLAEKRGKKVLEIVLT